MTVATSTEDDEKEMKSTLTDMPVVILEPHSTLSLQAQQQPQIVHIPIPQQQQQQMNHVTQHTNQPQLQQAAVQTHSQVKYYYIFNFIHFIYF